MTNRYEQAKAIYAQYGIDTDSSWFEEIKKYEKEVLSNR